MKRARPVFALACLSLLALAALFGGGGPAARAAEPPTIKRLFAENVTRTSAVLEAEVDTHGEPTTFHFSYGPTTAYGTDVPSPDGTAIVPQASGDTTKGSTTIAGVDLTQGQFLPGQRIEGAGIPAETEVLAVGADTIQITNKATATATGVSLTAPTAALTEPIEGLSPGTAYHYKLFATGAGTSQSEDLVLRTYPEPVAEPEACPNATIREDQHATHLPDCRAYELVSPADKHGADVITDPHRVRISTTPETPALPLAATFASLGGFAGAEGSGVSFDYLAQRTAAPGTQGWSTRAISPLQQPVPFAAIGGSRDPLYVGDANPDLTRMVFKAWSPLTDEPNVEEVQNLYLREGLRGPGPFRLLSSAPAPLPSDLSLYGPGVYENKHVPQIAGASTDLSHVLYESKYPLTADAPASLEASKLYVWANGALRYVGLVPPSGKRECGPSPLSACVVAPRAIAGQGAGTVVGGEAHVVLHPISADGSRVSFVVPLGDESSEGKLYQRDDRGTEAAADDTTVQLNASERKFPESAQPATYWDAAADGSRVFFTSSEALTASNEGGFYMWKATPDAEGHHLTLLSKDEEPADGAGAALGVHSGVLGASEDGRTVYFIDQSRLAAGQTTPFSAKGVGIYAWHEGEGVRYVGEMSDSVDQQEDFVSERSAPVMKHPPGVSVSPDGRFLLISLRRPPWPGGADQGKCYTAGAPESCRELYRYDAQSGAHPLCVSCSPAGAAPHSPAYFFPEELHNGGAQTTVHLNRPISSDGSRVFFTTAESLLPADTNGVADAYEWEAPGAGSGACAESSPSYSPADGGCLYLLSSGTSPAPSYFLEASPDGHDVLFATRQQLNGWDFDHGVDLYDARTEGGFPEPSAAAAPCVSEEGCRGSSPAPPTASNPASREQRGAGSPPPPPPCPKGKVRRHGACVKPHHHRKSHHRKHRHHRGGSR